MTIVVITQPMYFPWPGFILQLQMADTLVWLDDVQFSKGSFTNRVQLMTGSGRRWMTIPLEGGGTLQDMRELAAADPDWRVRHRSLLATALRDRPCRDSALEVFDAAVAEQSLLDAVIASAMAPCEALGKVPQEVVRSSSLGIEGSGSDRVLEIVKKVGGTCYLTGHGAARYLKHQSFENEGVSVRYVQYNVRAWAQPVEKFTPFVSVLDLIASVGPIAASSHLEPGSVDWRLHIGLGN